MVSIEWCGKQRNGIRFTKPNNIIAEDYIRKADEALVIFIMSPSSEWKAVSSYYACYDGLYALLQKAGIVCEIHECTIELMKYFDFNNEEINFVKNMKVQRVNAQYYVDRKYEVGREEKVKGFVLLCKQKLQSLDFDNIHKIIKKELSF